MTGAAELRTDPELRWYPHTYRGHFQQLSLEDRLIWTRFLAAEGNRYELYTYDHAVGGLDCDLTDVPEPLRRAWRRCTAKRIDVVAVNQDAYTLIEVRYQAGVSAVGALLVYAFLFQEQHPRATVAELRLLSDHMSPDTIRAAQHYGLSVTLYP